MARSSPANRYFSRSASVTVSPSIKSSQHNTRLSSWIIVIVLASACFRNVSAAPGRVVSWGAGQVFPATGPTDIIAISTALDHSLALKSDGTVFAWGDNMNGQCDVPPGLQNVTKIAAGEFFSVALKADGTIVTWGANDYGQRDVPSGLTGVRDISAGHAHCLALKNNGTIAAWGCNVFDQTKIPSRLAGVKSVLAVWNYSVVVKSNGTVEAWGVNDTGQTDVPAGLANVIAVAGNNNYCMALKNNGTITAWGQHPPLPAGLDSVVAIAAGETHAMALTSSGNIVTWGLNRSGETIVPSGLNNPFAIAASWHYSAALVGRLSIPSDFLLTNARWAPNTFSVSLTSQNGLAYTLEYKDALADSSWTSLSPVAGNGSLLTLTDNAATAPHRTYRVRAQ
jgi:alpha-tubulin suppressor-like RCC1 family protein